MHRVPRPPNVARANGSLDGQRLPGNGSAVPLGKIQERTFSRGKGYNGSEEEVWYRQVAFMRLLHCLLQSLGINCFSGGDRRIRTRTGRFFYDRGSYHRTSVF